MKKSNVGLYLLLTIQSLDFLANKSAYTNLSDYIFSEPSGLIAILLDIAVIIMGITLICKEKNPNNSEKQNDN